MFATLKQEVGEWSRGNFGDQPDINPYIGSEEEFGELADSLRFNDPVTHEELDAVGDILVYLADFCARRDLDYQGAYEAAQAREPLHSDFFREWASARGQMATSVLKRRQGIDQSPKYADSELVGEKAEFNALARMLCALESFAIDRGYTLEECIEVAWYDEVIDREWDSAFN
jgi:hypothetical protein